MRYFRAVVDFVNDNILWVLVAFCAAFFVEALVFIIRKFVKKIDFETDSFYVFIASDVFVILGAYILACLGFGMVNCIKEQDWQFWSHYVDFLSSSVYMWLAIAVGVIGLIVMFFVYQHIFDNFVLAVILAVLTAAGGVLALTILGFILYVLVSFLIILFKVLWFVFSGFFISMWEFIRNYWQWVLGILLIPGIIYGAIKAFINYLTSFQEIF